MNFGWAKFDDSVYRRCLSGEWIPFFHRKAHCRFPLQLRVGLRKNMHAITIKSYLLTFASNFGIQCSTVFQGVMLARILGVDGRGAYAAALLVPTLYAGIGLFGTNVALSRYAACEREYSRCFQSALAIGLMSGVLSTLFCCLSLSFLLADEPPYVLHLSQTFIPFILMNHLILDLAAVYQGLGDFKKFNLIFFSYYPFFLLGMSVLYLTGAATAGSFIILTLFCNAVVLIIALAKSRQYLFTEWHFVRLRPLLRMSLPFGVSGIVQNLILQVDRFVVLYCLGSEDLGLYVVALSAGSAIGSVGTAASQVIFSSSARLAEGEGGIYVAGVFRIVTIIYLAAGTGLLFFMPILFPLVYGREFDAAVAVACLLIPGAICSSLSNLLEQAIRAQGVAFKGLFVRIMSLAVLFGLGRLFCSWWGLIGMGIAYVIAQTIALLLIMGVIARHFKDVKPTLFFIRFTDIAVLLEFFRKSIYHKIFMRVD